MFDLLVGRNALGIVRLVDNSVRRIEGARDGSILGTLVTLPLFETVTVLVCHLCSFAHACEGRSLQAGTPELAYATYVRSCVGQTHPKSRDVGLPQALRQHKLDYLCNCPLGTINHSFHALCFVISFRAFHAGALLPASSSARDELLGGLLLDVFLSTRGPPPVPGRDTLYPSVAPALPDEVPEQVGSDEVRELRAQVAALAGAMRQQGEQIGRLHELVARQAAAAAPVPQDPPAHVAPSPMAAAPVTAIPPTASGSSAPIPEVLEAEQERSLAVLTAFKRFNPPTFVGESWLSAMEALFEDIYTLEKDKPIDAGRGWCGKLKLWRLIGAVEQQETS
ncbi:hypothetical protein ACMD2_23814 [Ananas comosus]|uniref:Uncharacterized protein n=1 Tax=Ananas comosus TaxID=4615 RepID=A0A199VCP4_ANACO|nr:hypothetical protein ACMD2_23814 [Ananas comosus]